MEAENSEEDSVDAENEEKNAQETGLERLIYFLARLTSLISLPLLSHLLS